MKKTNEKGRSMVEMLGVLVIIGVLSVAGLMGFKTALDKHKANELLQNATIRAATVSMQLASNREPDISEFADTDKWEVDTTGLSGQFKIIYTDEITDPVCDQMNTAVGSYSTIKEIGGVCSYFLFNNDLSPASED